MSQELIVKKSATFKAPIDKVWDALTNPKLTPKYMYGCALVSNWGEGDEVLWTLNDKVIVKGNVVKIEPGRHLHFTTFDPNVGLKDIPSNYINVTYTLRTEGQDTVLEITQGDFSAAENPEKRFEESASGWDYAIQGLRALLET